MPLPTGARSTLRYVCQAMIGFSAGWMRRNHLSVHLTQDKETAPKTGAVGPRLLTWAGYS